MQAAAALYRGPDVYVQNALEVQASPAPAVARKSVVGNTEWVIVGAAIIVVLIVCVLVAAYGPKPGYTVSTARNAKFRKGSSRLHAPIRTMVKKSGLPPLAPLWWDDEEGAYMIELVIGAGLVELVLDTGSSQLSAKGSGCQWTNCEDGGSCSTRSCPCGFDKDGRERTDCSGHYYQPTGTALNPGEQGAGTSTQLTYGSQEDTVSHYMDAVGIPHVPLTCTDLAVQVPEGPRDQAVGNADDVFDLGNVVVHRVHQISGSSSSNLLGLARPALEGMGSAEQGKFVVLDKLYGGFAPHWSIILRPEGGWWAMGPLPCFKSVHYMPLVDPPAFNQFLTHFYVVDIHNMAVGPTPASLKKVRNAPKYAIIDTGTTYTYASTRLGDVLDKMGFDEASWYIEFELGDRNDPVKITYSPEQMQDPDFPTASVLQCSAGRTLDDYDSIFPRKTNVLLFGAIMMRNCYWEFDLDKRRLGVQPLLAS
jgi:Flp pilus assembly pilin Flp